MTEIWDLVLSNGREEGNKVAVSVVISLTNLAPSEESREFRLFLKTRWSISVLGALLSNSAVFLLAVSTKLLLSSLGLTSLSLALCAKQTNSQFLKGYKSSKTTVGTNHDLDQLKVIKETEQKVEKGDIKQKKKHPVFTNLA